MSPGRLHCVHAPSRQRSTPIRRQKDRAIDRASALANDRTRAIHLWANRRDGNVQCTVPVGQVSTSWQALAGRRDFGSSQQTAIRRRRPLDVRLVEDDFRRRWNKARGLVQEPLNHKLLRSGKITDWGSRFLQSLRANTWLKNCSADNDVRLLKLTESWLRHLWDDASDNAEMVAIRKGDFSEMWYVHPENVWLDDTKRRFGYRADRLHRRRISEAELREIDATLPETVRPSFASTGKEAESDDFFKVSRFCDTIFAAVEAADAQVEKYQTAPNMQESNISESELAEKLGEFGISMRVSNSGTLEVSTDDLDRLDDGFVDEMNPRALFDDFATAWAMTRMNAHEQLTVLDQSVDGPSGTSQMTFGDLLVAPEEPADDDEAGDSHAPIDSD